MDDKNHECKHGRTIYLLLGFLYKEVFIEIYGFCVFGSGTAKDIDVWDTEISKIHVLIELIDLTNIMKSVCLL